MEVAVVMGVEGLQCVCVCVYLHLLRVSLTLESLNRFELLVLPHVPLSSFTSYLGSLSIFAIMAPPVETLHFPVDFVYRFLEEFTRCLD